MPRIPSWISACLLMLIVSLGGAQGALAQAGPSAAPTSTVDVKPLPSTAAAAIKFDPDKATNAYLARISGAARAKSDSYFEGGYVLQLVDAVYALAVIALLLWLRISARMRNIAQNMTRSRFWQVPIYAFQYTVLTTLVGLPLTIYEGFIREHAYGLSNQNFLQWFGDYAIDFGVSTVGFVIVVPLIYAAIRSAPRTWWMWSTCIALFFLVVMVVIAPVFISPLFNHYSRLPDSPIRTDILSLARANGIPANDVYVFDASRQSKRISANVSGFLGTTRISLNDNLLHRSTPREIKAVLGHEMGHYVLNHTVLLLMGFGIVIFVMFGFINWGFGVLINMFGGFWNVRTIDDPAGLPVIAALVTFFFLVATPVTNSLVRMAETQADIFGVNAARQPDGFAEAALQLSEYRKLDPSPLEEIIFYDHPSGRNRIAMMMRWKAEHLNDPDIKAGPVSPQ